MAKRMIKEGRLPKPEAVEAQLQRAVEAHRGEVWTYECTLVTPMFGGGVRAGEVDRAMPIRATGIRGQLRFWWRLLNRRDAQGRERSSKELFQAERAIWGGLDKDQPVASKVAVRVDGVNLKGSIGVGAYPSGAAYALYPAKDKEAQLAKVGAQWHLHVDVTALCSEARASVEQAVRWWAAFGGVGARTRRGCGSVDVRQGGKRLPVTAKEIAAQGVSIAQASAQPDAVKAWEQAVSALMIFRQGEGFARPQRAGMTTPGRSYWPEPDAIRRLENKWSDGHAPVHGAGNVFPRAAFGLPLIARFKNVGHAFGPRDPETLTIKPIPAGAHKSSERMASPIIVRAVRTESGWAPAALLLPTAHVWSMAIEVGRRTMLSGEWWPAQVAERERLAQMIKPLEGRGGDPLLAFMQYLGAQAVQSAPGKASSVEKPLASEERWERVRVTRNASNGALCVQLNGRDAMAIGSEARKIWGGLSDAARQALERGKAQTRIATVRGKELVALEIAP